MSTAAMIAGSNAGKKAVHVKWAGKTIALGTFPSNEADEKCARAKALTRAWRSTMRPKPSRDWVMLELERLGVRVVSGRLGRKAGEEGEDETPNKKSGVPGVGPSGPGGGPPVERSNSMGWGGDAELNNLIQRRNSSLGMSMMTDPQGRRGSLSSLGPVVGLDGEAMPPHRPLVGGGAAAAYEAARHDHYTQQKSVEQQRRASSLGLGSLAGGGLSQMGMSVNPNQHYEMLKLHHMNLLNEIQETTLMMNLYQQQQLQQQQQQLQHGGGSGGGGVDQMGGGDPNMAMLLQQQNGGHPGAPSAGVPGGPGVDQMFQQQRASLGLGSTGQMNGGQFNQMQMLQQQQRMMQGGEGGAVPGGDNAVPGMMVPGAGGPPIGPGGEQDTMAMQNRLNQLKDDIARREQENLKLGAQSQGGSDMGSPDGSNKRAGDDSERQMNKRSKVDGTPDGGGDNE